MENLEKFDSNGETGKNWKLKNLQKINREPRLSFGKKKKSPLFSPETSGIPEKEYETYNLEKLKLLKTQWKKWKTLWETRGLFHKHSGKPGGKSGKMRSGTEKFLCQPTLFTGSFLNGADKHDTMKNRNGSRKRAGKIIFDGGVCL